MGIIELKEMEFYAYHGCFKEEQIVGNKFLVDLILEAECEKAMLTDDISDAVNYQTAYDIVKKEMEIKSHLLENIGHRIIEKVSSKMTGIKKITVKIAKVNPPLGGKVNNVSVKLIKNISDNQ